MKKHEHDIRFRGPLSEREFRIMGWICLILAQVTILMNTGAAMNPALEARFLIPGRIISTFADLALPFLLIANISVILNNTEDIRRQLLRNFIFLVLFGSLFLLVFYHYGVGLVAIFTRNRPDALTAIKTALTDDGGRMYICFNIFVDLFLCALFTFFLFYNPVRPVKRWVLVLFRLSALLPVAYEALSIYIKYLALEKVLVIPVWAFPLLPVKPPMTYVLFVVLALAVKIREYRHNRHGYTMMTNRDSLHFSIVASITSLIAGLTDFLIFILFTFREMLFSGIEAVQVDSFRPEIINLDFGDSVGLIILAPILMFFSYNRECKNKTVIALIPVVGVFLIILVYLQGTYQLLNQLPVFLMARMDKLINLI